MFTGIIEAAGRVTGVNRFPGGIRLTIRAPRIARQMRIGSSVAVNGACLTATRLSGGLIQVQVIRETLDRTALGRLGIGDRVNLELPLRWQGRLDGHFVLGHVDGVGEILQVRARRQAHDLLIRFPKALGPYFLEKGSVTVDGVSLTLGKVEKDQFWIHLIPHTLKITTLSRLMSGNCVNLEADILIKSLLTLIDNPRRQR